MAAMPALLAREGPEVLQAALALRLVRQASAALLLPGFQGMVVMAALGSRPPALALRAVTVEPAATAVRMAMAVTAVMGAPVLPAQQVPMG